MKTFKKTTFKKGAASFYIVAFSTLILVIIATSFAALIISEMTRTSNDDLSQSAYDSALAGVEDAKLAFNNYRKCLGATPTEPNGDNEITCGEIVWWVQSDDPSNDKCSMVAHILGRIGELESGPVEIQETNVASNNMSQSYTCVTLDTILSDYRSTLTSGQPSKLVKVKLGKDADGNQISSSRIKHVRISWYSDASNSAYRFSNYSSTGSGKVVFPSFVLSGVAIPPTISLTLIQTAEEFSFNDFDKTIGNTTDRGTVFLVPFGNKDAASIESNIENSKKRNYVGTYDGSKNTISAQNGFLKSNDKVYNRDEDKYDRPFAVYCPEYSGNEFGCSALIEIPDPVGGARNDDTFAFVVSLLYGKPSTDFALEFLCADGAKCAPDATIAGEEGTSSQAYLDGSQVKIDSTGRANDLFRRVESRLEPEEGDLEANLAQYAITLTDDGDDTLRKRLTVTREWDFGE